MARLRAAAAAAVRSSSPAKRKVQGRDEDGDGDGDEDELPDLAALLFSGRTNGGGGGVATSFEPSTTRDYDVGAAGARRSPRKRAESSQRQLPETQPQRQRDVKEEQAPRGSPRKRDRAKQKRHVKVVEEEVVESEEVAQQSAQQQWQWRWEQRPLKLAHVNSLLLPLSQIALGDENDEKDDERRAWVPEARAKSGPAESVPPEKEKKKKKLNAILGVIDEGGDKENEKLRGVATLRGSKPQTTSSFVLKEARCNDDTEDSVIEEEDEEDTDLSGFVVDDEADLSIHISSGESDVDTRKPKRGKRKLQRGRQALESEDEVDRNAEDSITVDVGSLAKDLFGLKLEPSRRELPAPQKREIEVVDLTGSPEKSSNASPATRSPVKRSSSSTDPDNDAILKFSPPRAYSPIKLAPKALPFPTARSTTPSPPAEPASRPTTPTRTTTPPRPVSPTKLKSPSKAHLLSPSKRGDAAPRSPHRPSVDAFWSSDVVNTWHDQFSPKKAPVTSPRKNRLAQFSLWADEESEEDSQGTRDTSDPPTPCTSPRKARTMMQSPEKKRVAEEKRARKEFAGSREGAARELLAELDTKIAQGKLASMSDSTGGVKIVWSKTLRSTAGRANWRRTVTKSGGSGSPIKGSPMKSSGDVLVQHYASIELAEKVIDSNEKLANTLAHEFCHLANFMVSNVRDQPHGASFRAWAERVTREFAGSGKEAWRQVEVTTKHSYAINHKYLWVCAGREMTDAARWLRMEEGEGEEDGCGAEYGRHSKSIDTEKHRCGKCKGVLVQVRPVPRRVEAKRLSPRKNLFQKRVKSGDGEDAVAELGRALEVVELSD